MQKKQKWAFAVILLLAVIFSFSYDNQILLAIAGARTEIMTSFFKFISFLFSKPVIFLLTILILLQNKKLIPRYAGSFFATLLIVFFLKTIISKSRPDAALALIEETGYSFPSGTTAAAFASLPFTLLVLKKNKSLIILSAVIAALISLSRIYLGVHYLSDVIAGSLLGFFISYLTIRYFPLPKQKSLKIE